MKSRFGKLVKNEWIKIFSKLGTKIILAIVLVIAFFIPIFTTGFNRLFSSQNSSTPQELYENYEESLEAVKEDKFYDKTEKTAETAELTAYMDSLEFFISNDIDDTWKFEYFIDDMNEIALKLRAAELVANNTLTLEELSESGFGYILYSFDDKYDISGEYQNLLAEFDSQKAYILGVMPSDVTKSYAESIKQRIASHEEFLSMTESSAATDPEVRYEREQRKLTIEALSAIDECMDYIVENNVAPDDWRYSEAVRDVLSGMADMYGNYAVPEEEFYEENKIELFSSRASYSSFAKSQQRQQNSYRRAIEETRFAVFNNVKPEILAKGSQKGLFRNSFSSSAGLITIIICVIGCSLVTQEYSSGSIRLLLTRPRTKFEIFNSKYVAVFLAAALSLFAAFCVTAISTVISGGFGDMFGFDLINLAGPLKIPSVLLSLWKFLLELINMMLWVTLGILFGALFKKTALSVTFTLIITYFSEQIANIATLIIGQVSNPLVSFALRITILPYTALSEISTVSVNSVGAMFVQFESIGDYISAITSSLFPGGTNINVFLGCAVILAHTALLWFFGQLVFRKQEIKG